MLYPSSVRLLGISVFGLPSSAQTTFISTVREILPSGLRLSSTSGLWSWESAKARPLACVGRTPYSGPGELSMWEAEVFIGRLVDFGGLMATGGDPSPGSRHGRSCPFLLPRSEAYRTPKAWRPSGCRGPKEAPRGRGD